MKTNSSTPATAARGRNRRFNSCLKFGKAIGRAAFAMLFLSAVSPIYGQSLLDATFDPNANGTVLALAIQPDGKILVGGDFTSIGGQTRNRIARLNSDGTLDTAFNPNATSGGGVHALAIQPDGKILVGGVFSTIGGQSRNRIARLNSDGTLDTAFNPSADSHVFALAIQPDGKILVGGVFITIGGQTRNRIARLNSDGTLDTAFNPNANSNVESLAIQPDGKILVGGQFTTIGEQTRNRIARLNSDGTLDTAFNPNADGFKVEVLAFQPDGKILVGGDFTTIGGQTRNRIARLNSDGTLTAFNPNASSNVESLAIQPDGKILVGGIFTTIGGQTRNAIARLNSDGTLDTTFIANTNNVVVLAIQPDGKILVGGFFTTVAGVTRNRVARLNANATAESTISGQITNGGNGASGVSIFLTGSSTANTSTDGMGNYSFINLLLGGNYTVTPQSATLSFSPVSQTFNNLQSNQTANFTAAAGGLIVTNTNDSGAGSLRQAIIDANSNPDASTISFNIPGSGPHTINLLSVLPFIETTMAIDASTQPGYVGVPLVELNGADTASNGFYIGANNCLIRGFVINRFNGDGISVGGNNNTIAGNYIGTNITGTAVSPNRFSGVYVFSGSGNTIGGTSALDRNVISGASDSDGGIHLASLSTSNNVVIGNYIGTNAAGTVALGGGGIVINSPNNRIGGTTAAERNLISGNLAGLVIEGGGATGNSVQGNYIGTNAAGTAALPNTGLGVRVSFVAGNIIGGSATGAGNLISGNASGGVSLQGAASGNTVQGNFIGTDATGTLAMGNVGNGIGIDSPNNIIGGMTPGARNIISGNRDGTPANGTGHGIVIGGTGATGNNIQGNYIGTNAAGSAALANARGGVFVFAGAANNVIGGLTGTPGTGPGNLLSGNASDGISIQGISGTAPAAHDNQVLGNLIGTDASGTGAIRNVFAGVRITGNNNLIGGVAANAANIIAFNGFSGVSVPDGTGNAIQRNAIFSNGSSIGSLGIDLGSSGVKPNDAGDGDTGANNLQNFPVLSSAANAGGSTTIQGSLNSLPGTEYRVELFNNSACDAGGNGEGQNFIGSVNVTTDGAGNAAINTAVPALPNGSFITSTATRLDDGIPIETSEFSECLAFPAIALKADYQFQGNLDSTVPGAPAMTNLIGSGANSFVPDTIDGYSRQSLRFPFNSGVSVNTAGLIPNNSYTVVFLFKFDEVSGFRRVLDLKNRTTDNGGYIQDGRLEFESPPGPLIDPNSYIQIAAVRDQSGGLRVYRDGVLRVNLVDANNDFEISPANIMSFFQDDLVEPNEASAGNVARIRLFDGPLTTVQIQALDRVPEGTPTGQQDIVFVSSRDGNTEIYTMNIDGSEQRRLTNNTFSEFQPNWSPDGSRVAFSSARDGNSDIYTMNADGSNQTRITNNTFIDQHPNWSPDGTKFVFTCQRGSPLQLHVCIINSDGTGESQLTSVSSNSQPKWSPNGAQIVFVSDRLESGNLDVNVMDANGGNIVRLSTAAGNDWQPDWSPDGTQIVFSSLRDGNFELYKMSANGANQTRLTNFPTGGGVGDDAHPSYSPDGSKIAFTRGLNSNGNLEIFTMNADGTNPQRLTNQPGTDQQADWRGQGGGGGSPCTPIQIAVGNSVNGSLSVTSCNFNGNPHDFYSFTGTVGQQIVISLDSLGSGGIQPSLQLVAPDGETILAQSSGSTNARIPAAGVFTLPSAGVYTIRVSTLDNVGAYTLSLVEPPANVTCVYAPSPTNTNVAPSGVPASGGTSFFFDVLTQDGCPSASASVGPGSEHISIVSNSGGRVTFNVSPHSGQLQRVGTILAGERVHTVTQFGVTPPANDTFLQAQTLPSTSGSVPGRNTNAAAEAGEPQHLQGEAVGRSVWYKWTAPSEGGRYSFTTSGSDFDTVMAIYTGTSVGGLTRIAGNDDTTSFDLTSKVNFFSTGGTTYYIAVDGKSGASGSILLSYSPFRRLFRLYLQNFNGTASPISPSSVTTRREDGTGQTITGDFISLGVYEFDLPEDNAFYTVTIDGPAGITWSPPTYRINNSSSAFNPLMMNLQGGDGGTGQNQISNATNTIPRKFKGFVHGISNSADLALFSVHIGSTGTSSAVAPINCSNPPFTTPPHLVAGGPGGAMRVQYECETQPNTTHQILPSAPGKAFVVPALPLQVLNTDSGPFDANAITAVNSATYSIGGRITANGQGLGGATIDISSGIISIRTTSNGNGDYVFPDLAPNLTYMVKATRGGFVFQPQPVALQSSNVTLNITAQACAFTLSGFGQFEEDGGPGQINVTATTGQTCEWTAERGAGSEWININSGGSLGSGQVQFTVQSNNGAARTGTIIAGGQVFTVSQFSRINVVQPFSTRFDFDGDRNADLSVYRPSNNLWYVRRSTAGYMTADYAGAQGDFMAPADYDGDRKADIAFFRPSNGTWYIFGSATQTLSTFGWGQSGDIPAPADHDGDRKADLVVFRPSTGTWFRKLSLDDSLSATFFGTNGDKPVIGDFDGDGKDDIALYRVTDNNWYILKTREGFAAHTWGQSGDIPVPADYNGDGITDIVIYRPLTGQWYRILSNRGIDIRSWGEPGDIPVAADYDADGRVDIAIYRPSNVTWYIVGTSAGIFLDQFGTAEDRPTPNSFAY